jgi:hypothetical protein
MASPDAAEEAFHLWNAVESPLPASPRRSRNACISAGGRRDFNRQGGSAGEGASAPPAAPAAIRVDAGPGEPPSNVAVPTAPVQPLTRTPPARIQVANVAYCDTHGWTVVVQVPVVLCSLPLDESSPPTTRVVLASPAREPVAPRASSPVTGHRRSRSPSSPPSGPPRSVPRVNGSATAAGRPLANGHATETIAARRGLPPLRLFSRDADDTVVEPALQASAPPPPSSPPVSPALRRTWINVPHGPSAPPSPSLAHVVVCSCGSPSSGTQGSGRIGGQGEDQASPSGGGLTRLPPERPSAWMGEPLARPRRRRQRCGGRWRPHPRSAPEIDLWWSMVKRRGRICNG